MRKSRSRAPGKSARATPGQIAGEGAHATESLKGRVALITGASRGIGFAIAKALAAEGCDLIITSRDSSKLRNAGRELERQGIGVLAKTTDVGDEGSVRSLFESVKKEFGRLDFLINNAGIAHQVADLEKISLQVWQDVLATNLTGLFLCTKAALPLMRRGSTIMNNLSVAAKSVFAGEAAYCASKHGGLGFTNTLREELRGRGIRVIALLPGTTDTDIWDQLMEGAPRNRMMRPETVAEAAVNALLLPADSTVEEITISPTTLAFQD